MDPKRLENEFSLHIEVDDGQAKRSELIVTTQPGQDEDISDLRRQLQRINRSDTVQNYPTKDDCAPHLLHSSKKSPSECSYPRYARPARQEGPTYGSSITCMQCQYIPESGIDSENLNLLRSRDFKPRPPYHEKINLPPENIKSSVTVSSCQQDVNALYNNAMHAHSSQTITSKQSSRSSQIIAQELLSSPNENLMKQLVQSKEKLLNEGLKQEPSEMTLQTMISESVAVQTESKKISTRDFGSQINSKLEFSIQDMPIHVNKASGDENHTKSSTPCCRKYEESHCKKMLRDRDVKCTVQNIVNKCDGIFDHGEIHFKTGYIVMFVITLKLFVLWLVAQIFVLGPYITFGDSSNDNNAFSLSYIFSKIVYYLNSETVIW